MGLFDFIKERQYEPYTVGRFMELIKPCANSYEQPIDFYFDGNGRYSGYCLAGDSGSVMLRICGLSEPHPKGNGNLSLIFYDRKRYKDKQTYPDNYIFNIITGDDFYQAMSVVWDYPDEIYECGLELFAYSDGIRYMPSNWDGILRQCSIAGDSGNVFSITFLGINGYPSQLSS